jgi:hypothetical protein
MEVLLLSRKIKRRLRKWIFGRFLRRLEVDLLKVKKIKGGAGWTVL